MASSSKMYGVSFFLMMAFFGAAAMAKEVHVNWAADVDYAAWAANTTIVQGDHLYFDYVRNPADDVEQVSEQSFNSCVDGPYVKGHLVGENGTVLSEPGTYYFINAYPGKCDSGWKLQLDVQSAPPSRSGAAPSTLISLSTLTFPLCFFIFSLFMH